jgi:spore coat polysaccharide biosynthesis protein SpsF
MEFKMKYLGITQARVSSTRLPRKIFMEICGRSILEIHLSRILKSKLIDKVVVAIADEPGNEKIIDIVNQCGCEYVVGSVDDVLARFWSTASKFKPENVVRLTSDCPLIDSEIIDQTIQKFELDQSDYTSNCLTGTWPDGMDCEVFKYSALADANNQANLKSEREHVTLYLRNHTEKYKITEYIQEKNWGKYRMTIDTVADFQVIQKLIELKGFGASCEEYKNELDLNPNIFNLNSQTLRNEGLAKSLKDDTNVK